MKKREFMAAAGVALANMTVPLRAQADDFPSKPVTMMVVYPAGGISDVMARAVNKTMSTHMGQPVIIENLGGASGSIGAQKVLNAPSDGYYVLFASPSEVVLPTLALSAAKFKSEEFRMLQTCTNLDIAILARKDLPVSNADELIAYAAKVAKEGKPMTYASVGPGSFYHLLGENMARRTGVEMTHVPYKGGAPAIQDLVGGQVDIFITAVWGASVDMVKQGMIKAVAMLSPQRVSILPDVPSVNESKALMGFNTSIWTGFFVKRETPEPVVQRLHAALAQTMEDPAVRSALGAQGFEVARAQSLVSASKTYSDGIDTFRAIAKAINLKPL